MLRLLPALLKRGQQHGLGSSTHSHAPELLLVCRVQASLPSDIVVAVDVEEGAELEVLQGSASIQGVEWILWVVPPLVGQRVIHPHSWLASLLRCHAVQQVLQGSSSLLRFQCMPSREEKDLDQIII